MIFFTSEGWPYCIIRDEVYGDPILHALRETSTELQQLSLQRAPICGPRRNAKHTHTARVSASYVH